MKKNKIIQNIIIYFFLVILIWLCIKEYKDIRIKKQPKTNLEYKMEELSIQNNNKGENTTKVQQHKIERQYPKEEIEEEYKGYKVAAKIEIPKIKLETYILQEYSIKALKICVTKFWGVNANEIGNFCIAGHNYKNKNMFEKLNELVIGDTFFISDNVIGKIKYEIYDIYTVNPEDVSCLSQNTNNTREVTLITCTADTKKRIIVKAREK
jgi:LPXTG-site transpeptidase (sortase) family protein